MVKSLQSVRSYRGLMIFAMALVVQLAVGAGQASARLPDVVPTIGITYISAIHRPTGCVAKLEFSGGILLGATITDPLCLPHDVRARSIPAFKRDFHVPASSRRVLRGH